MWLEVQKELLDKLIAMYSHVLMAEVPDEQLVEVVAVQAARHGLVARVQLRKVRLQGTQPNKNAFTALAVL